MIMKAKGCRCSIIWNIRKEFGCKPWMISMILMLPEIRNCSEISNCAWEISGANNDDLSLIPMHACYGTR